MTTFSHILNISTPFLKLSLSILSERMKKKNNINVTLLFIICPEGAGHDTCNFWSLYTKDATYQI